jgi:hypothetical protein
MRESPKSQEFEHHLKQALMAANAINRAVVIRGFSAPVEREWDRVRGDLNVLAAACKQPPIEYLGLVTRTSRSAGRLERAEVGAVLEGLEVSMDALEEAIETQWERVPADIRETPIQRGSMTWRT